MNKKSRRKKSMENKLKWSLRHRQISGHNNKYLLHNALFKKRKMINDFHHNEKPFIIICVLAGRLAGKQPTNQPTKYRASNKNNFLNFSFNSLLFFVSFVQYIILASSFIIFFPVDYWVIKTCKVTWDMDFTSSAH